jgi:hypothetical protein
VTNLVTAEIITDPLENIEETDNGTSGDIRARLRLELLTGTFLGENGKTILLEYSGYGDSGGPEDCTPDREDLKDFLYSFVYSQHAGYENNDGGQGTVSWDLLNDVITLDHGSNYMSTEDFRSVH